MPAAAAVPRRSVVGTHAIGRAAIQQGYRVTYREAHTLLEEVAEAAVDGTRKALLTDLATVPLLDH
jgi:DNA replication protein DnaC